MAVRQAYIFGINIMNKYTVTKQSTKTETFSVQAESQEEAIKTLLEGKEQGSPINLTSTVHVTAQDDSSS